MNESITVSALNEYARALIENDEVLSQVWVEGEISGFNVNQKSGHAYFSLRDAACTVRAVMFSTYASQLRFMPKDGMYVVAPCRVTLYERDGSFQINVFDLLPRGVGSVQRQADDTKSKLEKEGLFAAERKRPLPAQPKRIAVITSASSAALQDILSVIGRRDPTVQLRVYAVSVQGLQAVGSIIKAIDMLNGDDWAQLAVIARGGGSKEDLWIFNDESLVCAAAGLRIPFISAVGHETDTTLLDYAADARAPTPSAAAELAVRDISIDWDYARGLYQEMTARVCKVLADVSVSLNNRQRTLKEDVDRLLLQRLQQLDIAGRLCRSLDPMNVLRRGYSRVAQNGGSVAAVAQLAPGDEIDVLFYDGSAACTVHRIEKGGPDGTTDV